MPVDLTEIVLPLGFFALVGALVLGPGYMKHRRDMAMIQAGMVPEAAVNDTPKSGRSRLERALTMTGLGLAITIGMLFTGFGPQVLAGLIPLFIGLSRLLSYLIESDRTSNNSPAAIAPSTTGSEVN